MVSRWLALPASISVVIFQSAVSDAVQVPRTLVAARPQVMSIAQRTRTQENPFPNFTPASVEVIYYAREETTRSAARRIEPRHLLVGVLRTEPSLVQASLNPDWTVDRIIQMATVNNDGVPIPEAEGVPMSSTSRRVIARALEVAKSVGEARIRPVDLLAAIVSDESTDLSRLLRAAGIDRETVFQGLPGR